MPIEIVIQITGASLLFLFAAIGYSREWPNN